MWTLLGGPDWMPITPNRGSFLHADSHEAGISSSYHIAKFFGPTKRARGPQKVTEPAAKPVPSNSQRKRRRIDVGAVISRALTAVGLKKH